MEKRFVGIKDLAVYLDLSENTVKAWVYQGKLPFIKMGRLIKFDLRQIEKWLDEKKAKSPAKFFT